MPSFNSSLVQKTTSTAQPSNSTSSNTKAMQQQQAAGPSMTDCERAGCLDHCPKTSTDPWIYAFVGTLFGLGLGGGIAYAYGKKGRKR